MTAPVVEPPVHRRFALRARSVRRASWWWKLGLPFVLVLLLGGAWFVWSGPVLVLKSVAVRGVPAGEADAVRSAAHLPLGRPLVRLDLAAARERVAAIRTVRSVQVTRSWPSGVTVTVTRRTPVAVVKDASGRLHLADSTGTTYAEVSSPPADLPLVTADAGNPEAVQSVVDVLAGLPESLRRQVASARADGADGVVLVVGKATVVWGSATDTPLKASVLQALRKAHPSSHRFDLSAPRAPSVA